MNMTYRVKVDELGRLVLPKQMRINLNIKPEDKVFIELIDNVLSISKVNNQCIFCDKEIGLVTFKDRYVCVNCFEDLNIKKYKFI